MNDFAPFLKAIAAAPDDDVPRLIAADWLDGSGQPERAEFVRAQVGGNPLKAWEVVNGIEGRVNEWVPLPGDWYPDRGLAVYRAIEDGSGYSAVAHFRRGFVEELECTWEDWCRHADAILAATPLRKVRLTTRPEFDGPVRATSLVPGSDRLALELLAGDYPGVEFELPPANLRQDQVQDIVEATVRELSEMRFSDLSDQIADHAAFRSALRRR